MSNPAPVRCSGPATRPGRPAGHGRAAGPVERGPAHRRAGDRPGVRRPGVPAFCALAGSRVPRLRAATDGRGGLKQYAQAAALTARVRCGRARARCGFAFDRNRAGSTCVNGCGALLYLQRLPSKSHWRPLPGTGECRQCRHPLRSDSPQFRPTIARVLTEPVGVTSVGVHAAQHDIRTPKRQPPRWRGRRTDQTFRGASRSGTRGAIAAIASTTTAPDGRSNRADNASPRA